MLRRIYRAPELFQLLATFARRAGDQGRGALPSGARKTWSARARRASRGAVEILGQRIPAYDLLLIVVGPVVLGAAVAAADAHALGRAGARRDAGPRDGRRARRQPGQAVHLGVLRSARCWPAWAARCRCRASRPTSTWISSVIADAFVVTVVGGLGSIAGAFLAAMLIGVAKAFCIGSALTFGSVRSPSSRWWSSS